jgi:hypothetical protein
MRGIFGPVYDFFPQTFSLPNDYVRFVRVYAEEEEKGVKVCLVLHSQESRDGIVISNNTFLITFKGYLDL